MQEGIYFGLKAEDYHAAPGLSHSGMRELAVSPLAYWHRYLDPERKPRQEPTPAQRLGTILHTRILEPGRFAERYAKKLSKDDYPKALVTVEDLKGWLGAVGLSTKHARKQELIDRVNQAAAEGWGIAVVWDTMVEQHARDNAGRELLDADDWRTVDEMARAIQREPAAAAAFDNAEGDGAAEVSLFVRDPATGVMCKARLDWAVRGLTADLKSFSNPRRKPFKQAIDDAIYHEGYYAQAVWYHDLRELARRKFVGEEICAYDRSGDGLTVDLLHGLFATEGHRFAFVFVESTPPYGLDVVALKREVPGAFQSEAYWTAARAHHREMIRRYAANAEAWGGTATPWRLPVSPRELEDTDMPFLAFHAISSASNRLMAAVDALDDDEATGAVPAAELEASQL